MEEALLPMLVAGPQAAPKLNAEMEYLGFLGPLLLSVPTLCSWLSDCVYSVCEKVSIRWLCTEVISSPHLPFQSPFFCPPIFLSAAQLENLFETMIY